MRVILKDTANRSFGATRVFGKHFRVGNENGVLALGVLVEA